MTVTARPWAAILARSMAASILPGEETPPPQALEDAASFLLEAARHRAEGKPAILIRSAAEGLGGSRRATRIAVINRDVPFLVDSVSRTLADAGLSVDLLLHPIVPVLRDAARQLVDLPEVIAPGSIRESFIYIETDRVDARQRRALEGAIAEALADVRAAVADWPAMRAAMESDAALLADGESGALLRWLAGGMLTQLGHMVRRADGRATSALGICRSSAADGAVLAEASWERALAWFKPKARRRHALIVKANRISLVHRRVPLDLIIVPLIEQGELAGLSVHAGIWTSAALGTPPQDVPVLRQQLAAISRDLGFVPGSHDHKALVHALSVLPHDLVIGFAQADTMRIATSMMALLDRPRPRLAVVVAPLERHLFAFVWLPRDTLSTATRLQIQALLEDGTGTSTLDWALAVEGENLAMLRYVLDARGSVRKPDVAALDARLQDMLRGWRDAVEAALAKLPEGTAGEKGRAAALALRHADAFPPGYRTAYGAQEAARDIIRLRHLGADRHAQPLGRDARLYRLPSDPDDRLRLKIYQAGGPLALSDAVPALENFGFRVLSEYPTQLAGEGSAAIHDFVLGLPSARTPDDLLPRTDIIETAITSVLNACAQDDVFNRLVITNALDAVAADWLRAFYRYLRQTGIAFTIYSVVDALAHAPAVTAALIRRFCAAHDPHFAGDRALAIAKAEEAIRAGLAQVAAINDDRILRLYWNSMAAVLRTNAFAPKPEGAGQAALAFKFDSTRVPGLPRPVPWREIFVYSPRIEGIHLRAGPVARGGLRWSDRRDDFRTEVLGLMKAQRVKNAVIVPTGAKGGFYPKQLPDPATDREGWAAEGKASYQVFIRTLLSITDNIIDGRVVHPQGVVVHDGPDPYFVVAADKGTATFSDTANAIAAEQGFWLGDAFASGGSNGYDHKAMGITARGAWISVQRHFAEMGVDVQKHTVRVAGCGDMSGDVFGNGMLLSKAIKLVAAFDHRHIFLDPDPDPAASWKERKRLFALPRSSWADYRPALISEGGGVFPRSLKQIPLSKEVRAALGVADTALDPESLISAILKSPVDLLWFGGIGTYVKGEAESHAEVGDPANAALRVNGSEVRAKVIGEGANLGVTQAGRIEFALRGAGGAGGRINTDFIDNSAGVDCSDNEVNIKIALAAAPDLDGEARNALLAEMTGDVAALVLEDNRLQALALSIAEAGGPAAVPPYSRVIAALEASGHLDRKTEGLAPDDALARRAAEGRGLTRPELAVLLSSAKLAMQDALEREPPALDEAGDALILADFPPQMQERFRAQLLNHRLRKEILATAIANRAINRLGIVHPFELAEEEGASLADVGCAFVAACALLDMDTLWRETETAAMPEAARVALFTRAAQALRGHMADLLRARACAGSVNALAPLVSDLAATASRLLGTEARAQADSIRAQLAGLGAPPRLAHSVARLYALDGAIGLASLAQDSGRPPVELAAAFISLGSALGIDWAQGSAALMSPADPWERLLVAGLARDFQQMRFDFLRQLAADAQTSLDERVAQWSAHNSAAIARLSAAIARARESGAPTPAMLAQIAGQARGLLAA
ncbi:NAD-glutamate dehydrogenase [Alteraurantiacibacter palmitatis]|uniref:NAD-glutamate dehydrogenase n=1 Tax=Alteraurantiacibacter palmitatis TaxID=2054628 RepID=A0ABV7E8X5_9SPHN